MRTNGVWHARHYQPDPEVHRTACGRTDNVSKPFGLTTDIRDVDCCRCQWTRAFKQAEAQQ